MKDREMHPISAGLGSVKAKLLASLPPEQAPLLAWQWVCGQRVAENARAANYAEEVLTVIVPDDGWRRELTGMAASYVGRINQMLPKGLRVVRINFEKQA
jgi:hypothetical protein